MPDAVSDAVVVPLPVALAVVLLDGVPVPLLVPLENAVDDVDCGAVRVAVWLPVTVAVADVVAADDADAAMASEPDVLAVAEIEDVTVHVREFEVDCDGVINDGAVTLGATELPLDPNPVPVALAVAVAVAASEGGAVGLADGWALQGSGPG